MQLPVLIGIVVGAVVIVMLIILMILRRARARNPNVIEARLAEYIENPVSLEKLELEQPFSERVMKPLVGFFSRIMSQVTPAKSQERLRRNLQMAGNPNGLQAGDFMALRLLAGILLGGVVAFLAWAAKQSPAIIIIGAFWMFMMGYLFPAYWLGGKIRQRKKNIFRSLPDAIDLLTISVEAGLGFDQALQRVTEKWDNELSKEFKRVLSEQRVGKLRRDALREMALRCDVQELSVFVASIIQADQLGVSLAKVLRIQAEQMRIRRRQMAEELAHKAPIKMLFPMVFLIFPSIYIVILGPAIPTIAQSMGFAP
ncbi:MAG TPA: type II secretion system F family protein [Chloroflexia bacterium]|nr:type II secretion system F family protein [Chloroflexia bacterium]